MAEQISLQGQLGVGQTPDGQVALIMDVGAGRSYVIGMPPDVAETIGKALLAPRVAAPAPSQIIQANGHGLREA